MRLFGKIALAALVVLAVGSAAGLGWLWYEDQPVDSSVSQRFRIAPGEPLAVTAQRLVDARLVRNAFVFRWLYHFGQGEGAFPSGTFFVPGSLTARAAAEWFRHAQPLQVKVTVPEGWTATKIARLLEEKQVVKAADFLAQVQNPASLGPLGQGWATLDGQLFPDTYQFPVEASAADVVKTFVQTFRTRTAGWAKTLGGDEFGRRLILASVVEREYRAEAEAPLIASVFLNRLEKGIPLGSCATIEYILTEIEGRPHPKRILFADTEIVSPFNTYKNKGLPPQAIANPGMVALRAAFEPAQSDYLYFVVKDPVAGTHTFSSLYSQHEKAREAYLNSFVTKG
jgi:UPF0755 protein